jgi:hypothetical protein
MKRSQASEGSAPVHKKLKMTTPAGDNDGGGEWTKVEKRKAKKVKKVEAKIDVCVSGLFTNERG